MEGIQDDRKAEKEITVTQLPNYGSERFFLLSELKLAGTVIECLDESIVQHEGEPPSKAMSPSRVAYTNLVYIVHEHKEGITAFQNQIDEVMDRVRLLSGKEESENETKTYVFGETHVTDNHNEPSKDQELKQGGTPRDQRLPGKAYCLSLLEYIDKKYPNIYERIIGVSNHTGACPSLDACVNLVNSLAKISSRQQRFRFVTHNGYAIPTTGYPRP
ncbi:hypothetical protein AAMO2058_000011000 [Amorphochlora amoebiformis]